ncbi:MAG TPA: PIN domain-containing protein [Opitutaceae bacterium]|nr:PIN domain-containing protein [Opitutaceae bacterium]
MNQNKAANKPDDERRQPPAQAQERGRHWSHPTSHAGMELQGPVHHVLVDFENVQAVDLGSLGDKPVAVTLLLGRMQKRLEVGLVQQLLQRPSGVRLIEMGVSGKNALDLALAYHLGKAAAADPGGCFHIISRDRDYDPLIAHLKQAGIKIWRHDTFSIQAILPEGKPAATAGKIEIVANRLRRSTTNRPKRKSTLLSHIRAQFQGRLKDSEAGEIVAALVGRGIIGIDSKDKVTYPGF